MKINKPMLPLKISLLLWFSGASIVPYFNLYIIQLGISISQFAYITAMTPILQFLGPTISGIIADKIGRSKPVLVANIILVAIVVNSILLVPAINTRKCLLDELEIQCQPQFFARSSRNSSSDLAYECFVHCASNTTLSYYAFNLQHENRSHDDFLLNNTIPDPGISRNSFNWTEIGDYSYNTKRIDSALFCESIMRDDCSTLCSEMSEDNSFAWQRMDCPHVKDNSSFVLTMCLVISCLFSAVISNCYRFMDVTSIFMVTTYQSDFGRERFWSIVGVAVFSPLTGYLIDLTTPQGEPRNCAFAVYFFDVFLVLLMISVYKLQVQIYPPGRNMIKNSLKLVKNLDVVTFFISVLVLGMSWGFTKIFSFIYLDRLGSPSILIGLLLAVNSVCGLPFLLTSNWWVKTLGSSNLLICGFMGYVILCLGYSFLVDPWHALIFESTAILTYHLLWVAVIRHSHEIAPEGLGATVVSLAGGIHYALGKGVGSLIGGQVMGKYGGRWAYRLIGIICGFACVIYGTFLYFRKRSVRLNNSYDGNESSSMTTSSNWKKITN